VTVKNTGYAALFVTSASSNNSEFAVGTSTCPVSGIGLAHNGTCTIGIGFTPSALGAQSATLTVSDNTAHSPQHVALSGTGTIDATVAPTSLMYSALLETDVQIKTVTVTNKSHHTLSLSESIGGADPGDFTNLGGCGSTLAVNSYCTIAVAFEPMAVSGTRSAMLAVTIAGDPASPHDVSLTGTGL